MTGPSLTTRFPAPDHLVMHAFADLARARTSPPGPRRANPSTLPRPWDPATCPPTLRRAVWRWLDAVVAWINHDHGWDVDRMIPGCWPAHPHLIHDLATLACLRYQASLELVADPISDWQRYTLPSFLDRTSQQIGPGRCAPGKHADWPGAARHRDYLSRAAANHRKAAYTADVGREPTSAVTAGHQQTAADPSAAASRTRPEVPDR